MFLIKLSQKNTKGEAVFSATAKFNLPEGDEFAAFGKELANFAHETLQYQQRSKSRGINTAMIRKTLPVNITIASIDDNDDLQVELYFKNFGKFISEATEQTVAEQLADSAEFTYKFSNWAK